MFSGVCGMAGLCLDCCGLWFIVVGCLFVFVGLGLFSCKFFVVSLWFWGNLVAGSYITRLVCVLVWLVIVGGWVAVVVRLVCRLSRAVLCYLTSGLVGWLVHFRDCCDFAVRLFDSWWCWFG